MRNGKIRRFRPRAHNKHSSRRQGHSKSLNGIHQINSHKNNFRNNTTKNPQSLERLVEKYKLLAKEALSSGDEVLNQNYLQHSDHFFRILSEVNESRSRNNVGEIPQNEKTNFQKENSISQIEEKK
tara:strand:+ start:1581 stop:1958 length:378 start_codon:yes stop_codon:yes gene_type:complete